MEYCVSISQSLSESEKKDVFDIWNLVYPAQITYKNVSDFEKYLSNCLNSTHYLLKTQAPESRTLGWLTVFDRDNERWFALVVHPAFQRKNIGTQLILEMQKKEVRVNGWVVVHDNYKRSNDESYLSPLSFYKKFGFILTTVTLTTDILSTTKITWSKNP